jgi:DNA invertase Pin-like site-specific DNA recombinase
MLIAPITADERLTTAHRAKLAYVYVRQSSLNQVRQHQESTELQYRLVDRAVGLGWPHERVQVIDEDLGKSGAGSVERHGFQKLIAEIGLGNAGLVVSLDASRLARNNRDWHQLLELCSVFGVLIADGERLYDPHAYHDRLLLGLSGIMSEAELHQIRMRLHQGERQKAARGELRLPLPAGLVCSSSLPSSGNYKAHAVSCASCARVDCRCRSDRSSGRRRTMLSGGKPIVRGFAIFFRIRPMLGRMSTAVGKRIRADAEPDRVGEPSRWQSEIGRFACKPPTLVILAGRSSWPTSGDWQTTSTTMRRDIPGRRAEARRCCKASQFAAAAAAG